MATRTGATFTQTVDSMKGILSGGFEPTDEPSEEPEASEVTAKDLETPIEEPEQEAEASEGEYTETDDEVEAEAEAEDAESEVEDDETTPTLNSLNDVAEALGTDADTLSNVNVTVKIDGESREVPLNEALKNYQLQGHVTQKSQKVAEEQRAFEEERQRFQKERDSRLQHLDGLAEALQQQMVPNEDIERYRDSDPDTYNQLRWQRQDQEEKLRQVWQQRQEAQQENQRQQWENYQKFLQEQERKLPEMIPSWSDPDVASKEKGELTNYLSELGFTDDEIGQVSDARIVKMARDAMKGSRVEKSKPQVTKKVQQKPKYQKPGAATSKRSRQEEQKRQNRKKLAKSHRWQDAVPVFKDMIKQG